MTKQIAMASGLAVFLFFVLSSVAALGNDTQVKIGVQAKRGSERCLEKWTATAKYLTARIPGKTFVIVPLGFDKIFSSVEKRECDFVLANPAFYVELESRYHVNRIATLKNLRLGSAYTQLGGVVFCRADRKDMSVLKDLKGKTYAAPAPLSLGGWIGVRRELKELGINPYSDLKGLNFAGTMDAVVYAVRDGKADAGSVRADTLERMAMEGKIDIKDFRIIGARAQTKDFPFVRSTRLYPEWPFAKVKHTSDELAEQVAGALLGMPRDSPAARTARCAGWTIPLNYQSVHECLKELGLGPYKDFGEITLADVFRKYWPLILVGFALLMVMTGALVIYFRLSRRILASHARLQSEVEERKRAEVELRKSEKRFGEFMNHFPAAVFIKDEESRFIYSNRYMMDFWGADDTWIGKSTAEIIKPEELGRQMVAGDKKALLQGHVVIEEKIPDKNGIERFFETHKFFIEQEAGPRLLGGFAVDITERKRAEEAVRESETRYRHLAKYAPTAIYEVDFVQRKIVSVNDAMCRVTGYTREELLTMGPLDILAEESKKRAVERRANFLSGERISEEIEVKIKTKSGQEGWAALNMHFIYEEGEPKGTAVVAHDITERKRAEEALRESEKKYRLLVENANDAILIFQDNLVKFSNPRAFKMIGYIREELARTPFVDFIHPGDRDMVLEKNKKRLAGDESLSTYTFRIINKNKEELWVQISAALTTWEGRPATINFLRDVTEQKRLEVQLQQARKMEAIGVLAGGIAHDFNNLLMGTQGRVSLMQTGLDSSHPHFEHLKEIKDYVKSAAELTKQLLGFARGGKYEVKPIDINDLIKKSSHMFGRTKKEIKIHEKYQEDVWTVETDRGQIEQVLMNLYINAWQAMPGGGELYLETKNITLDEGYVKPYTVEPGKYVKISVTDTGVGMDEATKQKIFEPFFTTKEMGRGTGLGLASAYGIIKNHGGLINVYSEKGEGTSFNIYLPASESEVSGQKAAVSDDIKRGHEAVLIVDDEEMILDVSEQLLRELGYKVLTAGNGKKAIAVYKENKEDIQIIILDMIMPGMGGGDVYDRLKEINPDIKVLLSSGYSLNGQAGRILERGCNGFIQKPFNMKGVSQKLREILDTT